MVDKKKYGQWQPDLQIPPTPDFDEAQISDKPLHRQSPPYTEAELKNLQSEYVSRARAVKSVDEMIGRVMETLQECELTDSTYFFFTSDNGYQLGQHRLHNKLDPYQMCTNVPLYVSGPGIKPAQTANHLLAHIDICPTILELAGATTPDFIDGKSFVKLLLQPQSENERSWRKPVVIENWQAKRNRGNVLPGAYSGLRYYDQVYVEWVTGDKEFYDLADDPFELNNAYSSLSKQRKQQLKRDLLASRAESMIPIVTVLPAAIETADRDPLLVRGFAEDDQSISRVSLTIQDSQTKQFWNGKSWDKDAVDLEATLSANDQQIIAWHYPLHDAMVGTANSQPAGKTETPIALLVNAWATDGNNNVSTRFSQKMSVTR
jgi:arylsulfatase A-like enzyme